MACTGGFVKQASKMRVYIAMQANVISQSAQKCQDALAHGGQMSVVLGKQHNSLASNITIPSSLLLQLHAFVLMLEDVQFFFSFSL